jgi:hypothetical protein
LPSNAPWPGVEVDWSAGTITAQAGSAADIRMPGPNAARPGAERRARAAAEAEAAGGLGELGLEKPSKDKTVQERASVSRIEYQSNGGVVLWLSIRFSDLVPAKAAPRALQDREHAFEIAPTLVAGDKEVRPAPPTVRPRNVPRTPSGFAATRRGGWCCRRHRRRQLILSQDPRL